MLVESFTNKWSHRYFSQFGEDALIHAFFKKKYPNQQRGFYIDIGAYSPKRFSNTFFFYKKGWTGINIDATPGSMTAFNYLRRKDVNLNLAVSLSNTEINYYCFRYPCVLNTTSLSMAESHSAQYKLPFETLKVPSMTLKQVAEKYVNSEIDFLTIDVEGAEMDILSSNDWAEYKPKLIVIELHNEDINKILESDLYNYLTTNGYAMYAWAPPTILFEKIPS